MRMVDGTSGDACRVPASGGIVSPVLPGRSAPRTAPDRNGHGRNGHERNGASANGHRPRTLAAGSDANFVDQY
jgi:hypothetical protein